MRNQALTKPTMMNGMTIRMLSKASPSMVSTQRSARLSSAKKLLGYSGMIQIVNHRIPQWHRPRCRWSEQRVGSEGAWTDIDPAAVAGLHHLPHRPTLPPQRAPQSGLQVSAQARDAAAAHTRTAQGRWVGGLRLAVVGRSGGRSTDCPARERCLPRASLRVVSFPFFVAAAGCFFLRNLRCAGAPAAPASALGGTSNG